MVDAVFFIRPSHLIYIFCNFFSKIFNVEKVMVFDRMDDFFSLLSTAALQLDIRHEREGWFKRCFQH